MSRALENRQKRLPAFWEWYDLMLSENAEFKHVPFSSMWRWSNAVQTESEEKVK